MNMSPFSVPSASLCESLHLGSLAPLLMFCGKGNHGNNTALSIKSRLGVTLPQQLADGRKDEFIHLLLFLPSLLCSAVMGSFEEGERAQSVSQGEGAVVPAPRIRSFPQPQVTWFRDGRKIPPSSRM